MTLVVIRVREWRMMTRASGRHERAMRFLRAAGTENGKPGEKKDKKLRPNPRRGSFSRRMFQVRSGNYLVVRGESLARRRDVVRS